MTRTALIRLARSTPVVTGAAFLVGYAFHSIRGVDDADTLWVGNLSWPYLVVPALACVGETRLSRLLVRPALASVAMVLGFYNALGLLTVSAATTGLPPGTSWIGVERVAWRSYLEHLVLGIPGGIPWLTVAVVTGAALGLLHRWTVQGQGRSAIFWGAVAVTGMVEPVFHFAPVFAGLPFAGYRFDGYGQVVSGVEMALALALLGIAVAHLRSPAETAAP